MPNQKNLNKKLAKTWNELDKNREISVIRDQGFLVYFQGPETRLFISDFYNGSAEYSPITGTPVLLPQYNLVVYPPPLLSSFSMMIYLYSIEWWMPKNKIKKDGSCRQFPSTMREERKHNLSTQSVVRPVGTHRRDLLAFRSMNVILACWLGLLLKTCTLREERGEGGVYQSVISQVLGFPKFWPTSEFQIWSLKYQFILDSKHQL